MRPIIFLALQCTYGVAILFEPTIYGLVIAGSGKELHGLVVRILTAVRVLTVGAFQNRIISG
jgi:hypothetical protein